MSKNPIRIRCARAVVKTIGVLAFFVLMSLPEAEFVYSKSFGMTVLLLIGSAILCIIPMILAGMVCAAEANEMEIHHK